MLSLLPNVMHVSGGGGAADEAATTGTLRLLDEELRCGGPGAETMVERLADVLFARVLRQYVVGAPERARGWSAAIHDGSIGRALALIHTDPAGGWSAGALAARVGMSRTRFFERFTELVGDPPARYLARSRVSAAVDLMRRRDLSTAEVASRVGYSSEKAFTKVFKRYLGASPSEYRRRLWDPAPAHAAA
jgi:AraC-like DNA-binding protein